MEPIIRLAPQSGAVQAGWIARRTPRGFRHRLLTAGGANDVAAGR